MLRRRFLKIAGIGGNFLEHTLKAFGSSNIAASTARHYLPVKPGTDLARLRFRQLHGRDRPATLVHPSRHAAWHGNDAQRSCAIALLDALLGSWGRKGGLYFPIRRKAAEPLVPAVSPAA